MLFFIMLLVKVTCLRDPGKLKYIRNPIEKKNYLIYCSKVRVKTLIMLQTSSISNKHCSFELSIHKRILKKIKYTLPFGESLLFQ